MELVFTDEQMPESSVMQLLDRAGDLCASQAGFSKESLEVSVTFVNPDEMRDLNGRYREKDSVTDVLSFPQYENMNEIPPGVHISLGDVVICTEQARRQADEFGHSYERELVYLFVHGILHLLTYDHETKEDRDAMRLEEEKILNSLDLAR